MAVRQLVCIVDDDESVRESLPDLLGELGLDARVFSCAKDLLGSKDLEQAKCIILDIAMPGMTGIDLQRELRRLGLDVPIIFITAQIDSRVRSRVVQYGAVACLFKPFSESDLVRALDQALGSPSLLR